jgi:glycosyltransferase involved in cell wall biosynthesis
MSRPPEVSVVMPAHNGGSLIDRAIASVVAQSFQPWELIVVDDGSTDDTFERVSAWRRDDDRITVVRNERNEGISRSLNRGVALAKSDLVARLDADDMSYRERLAEQVSFMNRQPAVVLCGTAAELVNGDGEPIGVFAPPTEFDDIRRFLLRDNPFIHSSVVFRRKAFDAAGRYSGVSFLFDDYRLWVDMCGVGETRNLGDVLVRHVKHAGSVTQRMGRWSSRLERLRMQRYAAKRFRRPAMGTYEAARSLAAALLRP